jgi:hypothetical protein
VQEVQQYLPYQQAEIVVLTLYFPQSLLTVEVEEVEDLMDKVVVHLMDLVVDQVQVYLLQQEVQVVLMVIMVVLVLILLVLEVEVEEVLQVKMVRVLIQVEVHMVVQVRLQVYQEIQ